MHLAYSAISTTQECIQQTESENERLLRYLAYQATCNKYSQEIAAVQQYLPGWQPKFSY